MSNVLEQLKLRRHREFVFDDGMKVGFHYPDIEELVMKVGHVPTPAVGALAKDLAGKAPTEEQALDLALKHPDEVELGLRYVKLTVATMLDDIDGEAITADDDREAIVEALEPEKRQVLFLIATREMDPDAPKVEPAEV